MLPHWNWKQGDKVDVVVYYNQADRVELYLNGKKIREQSRDTNRYDLVFKAINFEAGVLEVISYRDNQKVLSKIVRTAGKPYRIKLSNEKSTPNTVGNELTYVHAYVLDEQGTIVPDSAHDIRFSIEGEDARIVATDNGNTTDLRRFQSASRQAFHGKALAIKSCCKSRK
ncbi:hypothetical protein D3C86_1502440 [compost metagenome]